jgi:hypothetical protein
MIFRNLGIICELILLDLGFFHVISKIGVWYYEILYFQFSVMLYDVVKFQNLVLLFEEYSISCSNYFSDNKDLPCFNYCAQ